jgi:hypothetical protein
MENQELLNAIATLTATIDPLYRAAKYDAVTTIINKMLELITKLK